MSRILALVEGSTEEQFVKEVLAPYFEADSKYIIPAIVTTKRLPGTPVFKGGISSYEKIRRDILRLCRDTDVICVTTMIDYYGLPSDFPGIATKPPGTAPSKAAHVEAAFAKDIGDRRFVPHLSLHEFEACLFANPDMIAQTFSRTDIVDALRQIRSKFKSPEDINDNEPPSKRIEALVGEYDKPFFGVLIAQEIGLSRIRAECPHFNTWLTTLEHLGKD